MTNANLKLSKPVTEVLFQVGVPLLAVAAVGAGVWLSKKLEERDEIKRIQPVQVAGSPAYMVVDGASRTNYYRHIGDFKVEKINLEKESQKMIDYSVPKGGLLIK